MAGRTLLVMLAMALAASACNDDAGQAGVDDVTQPLELVNPDMAPALAGDAGWHYQRSAELDLNGDLQPERVVLTAQVEMVRGQPAWDDGQQWQVYIESSDGQRNYIYAQRLQIGTLTMRINHSEPGEPAGIVLLEHLADRLTVYEFVYTQPGEAKGFVRFQRQLDPTGDLASPRFP